MAPLRTAVLLLALAVGLLAGQALAAGPDAGQAAVVQSRCTSCHSLGMVCDNLGRDAAYWDKTVARMRTSGAKLDAAQATATAAWLAGLDRAGAGFCK